jgi:hypothetical protein
MWHSNGDESALTESGRDCGVCLWSETFVDYKALFEMWQKVQRMDEV